MSNWSNLVTTKKGAMTELLASAWLILHGYEVFRNVAPTGPADLVAFKGDEVFKVDVKSSYMTKHGKFKFVKSLRDTLARNGIRMLLALPNGECCWADEVEPEEEVIEEDIGQPELFPKPPSKNSRDKQWSELTNGIVASASEKDKATLRYCIRQLNRARKEADFTDAPGNGVAIEAP